MSSYLEGNIGPLMHALGLIYRATPPHPWKWRLSGWLFEHWLKRTRHTDLIRLNRDTRMLCNFCSAYGVWSAGMNYERLEATHFRTLLKPGMVFFDVGANVGYYSLLAAPLVGQGGGVHAFEPVSTMHEMLESNFDRNKLRQAVANRLIVSDSCEQRTINLPPEDKCGMSSVGIVLRDDQLTETVSSITLDEYIQQRGVSRVDVIKIDAEGHEVPVLKGARALLREKRPILLIEVRDRLLRQSGSDRAELYSLLHEAGYSAYRPRIDAPPEPITSPCDGELIIFRPN